MAFTPPESDQTVGFTPPTGDEVVTPAPAEQRGFLLRAGMGPMRGLAAIFGEEEEAGVGVTRAFLQGATFGFADEAEAATRALADEGDFVDAYFRNRNEVRQQLATFREERPRLALGAELAGGFAVPGIGTAKSVAKGATLTTRAGRGARAGAVTGALFGAGTAEELEDVPSAATTGAAFGAGIGALIPTAAAGVAATGRGIMRTGRAAVSPVTGAARRIGQALGRDRMTPQQIAGALEEARRLGRPARIADVGGAAVRRELEVAAQTPGAAAEFIEKALSKRNKAQLTRLSRDLIRGTGVKADDVEEAIISTMQTRSDAAKPVYQKAMSFSAELNDEIVDAYNKAVKTPLGKQALGKARKILNVENFDEAPLMERIDALKRGLDDVIGGARRRGEKGIAAKALDVKHNLVGLVDEVNPAYKNARQIWENSSDYLGAIDRGREIMKPTFTASRLSREFAEMTNAEKEAFRIGAVDAMITRMRQQSAKEPNLIKLLRSPEMRDKLKAIMTPKAATKLDKILDIEDEMFALSNQVLRGSQTAQRRAQMVEQHKQVGLAALAEELSALVITPIRNIVVRKIPSLARGTRDRMVARQNAIIAQRLLSEAPEELLAVPPVPELTLTGGRLIPPAVIAAEEAQQ